MTILDSAANQFAFSLSAVRALAGGGQDAASIDRGSIQVTGTPKGGSAKTVTAKVSAPGGSAARRQVMLLLDTSLSMNKQNRIDAERAAATRFVDLVETSRLGIEIGVVTFGDPATKVLSPTTDLNQVREAIRTRLVPKGDTAMFEAVALGVSLMDKNAIRSVLMISDGKNDDLHGKRFALPQARQALGIGKDVGLIPFTGVLVGDEPERDIFNIPSTPNAVVQFEDQVDLKDKLDEVVQSNVRTQQQLINASIDLPQEWAGKAVTVQVEAQSGGQDIAIKPFDRVFPDLATAAQSGGTNPVIVPSSAIPTWVAMVALLAVFAALVVLVGTAVGSFSPANAAKSAVVRRLEFYSVSGRTPSKVEVTEQTSGATRLGDSALTRSAVGLLSRLARSGQMDRALDSQLESAGLPLRTAEWMLLHIAIAVGSALLLLLISGGKLAALVLGLLLGLAGPWLFLALAKSRRESKFLSQLPDTLQLLAGSLAAGYSLPQAMDSVVRESTPPISVEFNRALIEARLGMLPEDALDGIAKRTASTDFSWIVMAIRIQRDVGGNLAELLSSVADTLRERERLRRQVTALSAEGRLSGLILVALPLVFGLYLMLTRPEYIEPLFVTKMGLFLLAVGTVLLVVGGFWMAKVIKVKV